VKVEVDLRITDSAIEEFKRILVEYGGDESVVRIFVQGGGCKGMSYGLVFVPENEINPEVDVSDCFDGLKVVVDRKSLFLLDGTTVEWAEVDGQKGFKFTSNNPKKKCGSSGCCSI